VRILARLTGEARQFRDGSAAARHFTPLADALVTDRDPGEHNQAMMELGATVCLRQNPKCGECPVAGFCVGKRQGTADRVPRFQPKRTERMFVLRTFCLWRGRLLLRCGHTKARRLAGVYELPELSDLGLKPDKRNLLAVRRRTITRFQITESIYAVKPGAALLRRIAANKSLEWVARCDLDRVTLSGPHRRWIGEMLAAR
jgi:A/G-specific adenine glycosylase